MKRNFSMVLSIILVTFVSLSFVGAAVLFQMQITKAKGEWYDKVEVSVYMCPTGYSTSANCTGEEATEEQIQNVKDIINKELSGEVESVYEESKAEAFQEFEKQYPGGLVDGQTLTEEDMQVTLRLKLKNPENYQIVSDVLSGRDGVESVNDQRAIFEPIFNALNSLTVIAVTLAGLMMLAAFLLIVTTIRLSTASRKNEVEIMRLVGASNKFIELPFVMEGVLSAIIGAIMAIGGLLIVIQFFINGYLASSIKWMNFITADSLLLVGPILIAVAVVLATIASITSLRRYLKI